MSLAHTLDILSSKHTRPIESIGRSSKQLKTHIQSFTNSLLDSIDKYQKYITKELDEDFKNLFQLQDHKLSYQNLS